jgi:hypothetical protein
MRRTGWIIFWIVVLFFVVTSGAASSHGAEVRGWIDNIFAFGHGVAGG